MRYAVLFGPPNSGKSTLFNRLTGQNTSVVNYPGSTVDVTFACLKDHSSVTFAATPFIDFIDGAFTMLGHGVAKHIPSGLFQNFIVNGLIAGFSGIIVFVPQIALLFLGMSVMEATGFLARSAVLIDKPLSKIGLNGRSFVPLLSGCACAIPAILATRTISNRRVRMLTMLAIPLMQCAARLPVFGLLLGALFSSPIHGAIGLTAIYLGSICLAALTVGITNRFSFKNDDSSNEFMIQLPKWRWPLWGELIRTMLKRTKAFITGAGPIIFIISLVLWGISEIHIGSSPLIYIIGQWIEPVFKPMGVDWRVGVALILSFAAREVFVSALAVVFQLSEDAAFSLTNLTMTDSVTPIFSTGTIIELILFFMVAMQCAETYAVLKKEMASAKWPNLILIGYILLAYVLAVLANTFI
tara:strand:+ start:9125 stop:10360 length:1236 start_codon:yes stop_codon:yes gene_type:complete